MDYMQALSALKQDLLPNKLIIKGEEPYLVKDLIKKITNKYIEPGMEGVDISTYNGKELEERVFITDIQSPSFFSEKRILIIDEAQRFKISDEAAEVLKNLDEGIIVIFLPTAGDGFSRSLSRQGITIDCKKISRDQMMSWIEKELRLKNKKISFEAKKLLVDQSRYFDRKSAVSLYFLKTELDKLAALEDREIKIKDVEALMQAAPEDNIFNMIDHLSKGHKSQAFKIYSDYLASGNSIDSIVPLMARNFYQLLMVKVFQESGLPIQNWDKRLGVSHNFIKTKLSATAVQYSRGELLRALDLCLEKEALYKSQSLDKESLIQNLLLELLHK